MKIFLILSKSINVDRIINFIKGSEKVYFIRYGSVIDINSRNRFIKAVENINPECRFALINVNIERPENSIYKNDNYLEINFTDKKQPTDWKTSYLDWKQIFMDIESNV